MREHPVEFVYLGRLRTGYILITEGLQLLLVWLLALAIDDGLQGELMRENPRNGEHSKQDCQGRVSKVKG